MLLARSAAAMQYIRFAGALYLVYLGIEKFRGASSIADAASKPIAPQPLHRIYRDGVIVNVLNPKTSLFFLSFLPQFIDPHHGSQTMQLLGYGGFFVMLALFTDGPVAVGRPADLCILSAPLRAPADVEVAATARDGAVIWPTA